MSTFAIYFSPTDSTETIVKKTAQVFGEYESVDLTKRHEEAERHFSEKDICVIGVPSYGGRVPAAALERMEGYEGNGAKAVLITAYGNRAYEDTLLELKEFLNKRGFKCAAAAAVVAEHSIMHQFASGRPDEKDQEEITQFAGKVLEKLQGNTEMKEAEVPGDHPYREYHGVPLKPKAGSACIRCGKCAGVCPVGAIPLDEPEKTDTKVCISCMRCVKVCPVHARKVSRLKVTVAGMKMKKACAERKENEFFL